MDGHTQRAADRGARVFALAHLCALVLAPLLVLTLAAWPFGLGPGEASAVLTSLARGLAMALSIALVTGLLAVPLARCVGPLPLLWLLVVGRTTLARGALALTPAPGSFAAGLALVCDLLPFAAILVWLRLQTWPRALDEAARDLGGGWQARLRLVAWPHLRPTAIVVSLWLGLQVLGDVVVFELAGGGHIYTPGLLVRDAIVREAAGTRALLVVLGFVVLALLCALRFGRELDAVRRSDWRPLPPAPMWLRVLAWGSLALASCVALAGLYDPHTGIGLGEGYGFADHQLARLALRSFVLALGVGLFGAALGLALALVHRRLDRGPRRLLSVALLAPLALPPSVLGLLHLQLATRLGVEPGLGLTLWALLGPSLALAFVCMRLATLVIPASLAAAAADLGADARARVQLVWLPLARHALVVSATLVAAWVLAQAALPSFTSGPGGDTLAVALTIHARAGELELAHRWSAISLAVASVCLAASILALRWRAR